MSNSAQNQATASAPARQPVSAFIIAFNEEQHIKPCIESLAFCDEVIVVDSGSSDQTREIAKACGAKVIEHAWLGYRKQKEFALSQTSHEWVINLDADERISPELKSNILTVLAGTQSQAIGYEINRLVYYMGRWWKRGGWYPEYRLRFFKKSCVQWGGKDPHEKPLPQGKVARMGGDIYHFTYRDIHDQVDRLNKFSSISSEQDFEAGVKPALWRLFLNPWLRFMKFYFFKQGYREGRAGFIIGVLEGYYTFLKYAKLWERSVLKAREQREKP